jgi:hypothetical protein
MALKAKGANQDELLEAVISTNAWLERIGK